MVNTNKQEKLKKNQETINSSQFLNQNKIEEFEFEKIVENNSANLDKSNNNDEFILIDGSDTSDQKNLKIKKKLKLSKPKKALIAIGSIVVVVVGSAFLINNIIAYYKNQNQGKQENFSPEQIIENNDNEIIYDDNGQIVVDPTTDEEIKLLTNSLNNKILEDANKKLNQSISSIDEIRLITQLPSNDCIGFDETNPENKYDKYMISILFSSNEKSYQLSYFTGNEFLYESDEIDKNILSDFIIYLNSECAIDNCKELYSNSIASSTDFTTSEDEIKNQILTKLGVNGEIGDYYYSYNQIGDLLYNIPIYVKNEDGVKVELYSGLAQNIDNYELDPLETFYKELAQIPLPSLPSGQTSYFEKINLISNKNLDNILNIFNNFNKKNITNNKSQATNNANYKMLSLEDDLILF